MIYAFGFASLPGYVRGEDCALSLKRTKVHAASTHTIEISQT